VLVPSELQIKFLSDARQFLERVQPPENRGRGFAGACVAALSQKLLDDGRKFCFLYTDLANPISNHIYQTIGYEPVADVILYSFS